MENDKHIEWDYETFRRLTHDNGDPEVAYSRARFAEKHNDFKGAVEDYSRAISLRSNYKSAYLGRGLALCELRQYENAIEDFKIAGTLGAPIEAINIKIAQLYDDINSPQLSLDYYNKAIIINPNNGNYFYERATVKIKLELYESAFFDLTKAIELIPDDALIFKERARVRGAMGDLPGAIADCDKWVELSPESGDAYLMRGNLHGMMANDLKATADLRKASSLGEKRADEILKELDDLDQRM